MKWNTNISFFRGRHAGCFFALISCLGFFSFGSWRWCSVTVTCCCYEMKGNEMRCWVSWQCLPACLPFCLSVCLSGTLYGMYVYVRYVRLRRLGFSKLAACLPACLCYLCFLFLFLFSVWGWVRITRVRVCILSLYAVYCFVLMIHW